MQGRMDRDACTDNSKNSDSSTVLTMAIGRDIKSAISVPAETNYMHILTL